jgi:hypothetical protein
MKTYGGVDIRGLSKKKPNLLKQGANEPTQVTRDSGAM